MTVMTDPTAPTDPAPPLPDPHAWAHELVAGGGTILHAPTNTIGKVLAYYDGVTEKFIDPNGKKLDTPVLKVAPGHVFDARNSDLFLPLDERETRFFESFTRGIVEYVTGCSSVAAKSGMPIQTGTTIMGCVLRGQAQQLDLAMARVRAPMTLPTPPALPEVP
jgi:hypothetical protein